MQDLQARRPKLMDEHLQLHHSADADVTALAVPDHVTASEHGSCLPPEDRVPVSLGAPAVHEDDRLSQEKELLEGEASETQSSSHSVEEKEPSELDSVQNGLESIPFDVWQERLLPMLSIRDVYRVCGVTRKIREMLYNEYTFKRLCEVSAYAICAHICLENLQLYCFKGVRTKCGVAPVLQSSLPFTVCFIGIIRVQLLLS